MSFWGLLAMLLLFLLLSAAFSGSETGVYSVSRVRLDAEAREGRRSARLLLGLLRDDAGLLVTLLIGNNLMLELLTHTFEDRFVPVGIPSWSKELFITAILTPVVFLFGELLPKDVFRRRPQTLLTLASPLLLGARALFFPLAWPIKWLGVGLGRLAGLRGEHASPIRRREEMLDVLREGTRTGALAPRAETLAHNVFVLRELPVERIMVPWARVLVVDADRPEEEQRETVANARFTRLPVVGSEPPAQDVGGAPAPATPTRVLGYVHQLEVLGELRPTAEALRPLPQLEPGLPLDRALAKLRIAGQRLALVGTPEEPRGLVALMDLVATLSRESGADDARAGRNSSGVAATRGTG